MLSYAVSCPSQVSPRHLQSHGLLLADVQIAFVKTLFADNPIVRGIENQEIRKKDFYFLDAATGRYVIVPEEESEQPQWKIHRSKLKRIQHNPHGLPFSVMRDSALPDANLYAVYYGKKYEERKGRKTTVGAGTEAVVKLAQNLKTGKWYAVKISTLPILPDTKEKDAQKAWQRVQEVVERVKEIRHGSAIGQTGIPEHVAAIRCKRQDRHKFVIIMEFIQGRELFKHYYLVHRDGTWVGCNLSFQDRLKIASMLIDIVSYMHALGIVHRDIKSENIIVVSNPDESVSSISLIDFGFVEEAEKILEIGKGTKVFMDILALNLANRPALPHRRAAALKAAECYSLGVVLWELFGFCGEQDASKPMPQEVANQEILEAATPSQCVKGEWYGIGEKEAKDFSLNAMQNLTLEQQLKLAALESLTADLVSPYSDHSSKNKRIDIQTAQARLRDIISMTATAARPSNDSEAQTSPLAVGMRAS